MATKRKGKKSDEQLEMESANREEFSSDVRKRFKNVPGSLKDAGQRIMRGLKPTIDEVVESRPAMKSGGRVNKYAGGGMSESKTMMRKEVAFMKKKGAPKSMVRHEMAEAKGKGYAEGGYYRDMKNPFKKRPLNKVTNSKQMPSLGDQMDADRIANRRRPKSNKVPNKMPNKMPDLSRLTPQQRAQVMKVMGIRKGKSDKMPSPRPGRGDGPGFKSDKMPNPRPRPRPGRGDGPGFKSDKMPNPRPRPRPGRGAGMIANQAKRPGTNPKTRQMPRPASKRPGTNPKTKQMPRPTPSRPTSPRGAEKMKNMPRPASRPTSPLIKKAAEAKAKAQRMPRPASKPTAPRQLPPMARKRGMAAGGDVYTAPGGPTRGKSGKIKKMASGGMAGMIPKEGKKSPNSMGTSYSAGGKVKGKAMNGCARTGLTRGRTV